ncbi:hypothetical protein Poly30_34550 [Planctomycetes bacterium Poly30]|uniref:Uncharacterized protein n=1 Tax=Saltatorellus ferox TaxID=2528018 RepID=A0A518EV02_9BACT|nr:hypothetical protein Poly30_34550 [Planctomycetes bacterium Poly30]
MLRFLASTAIALPGLVVSASSQSCDQGVIDLLSPIHGLDAHGGRVVVSKSTVFGERPSLSVFDAQAGSSSPIQTHFLQPSLFETSWRIREISLEGSLIAYQPDVAFTAGAQLVVHEETSAGWVHSAVPLPGEGWSWGHLTSISGDRIVAATTPSFSRPITLQIVERDPAGGWRVADGVETDILSPWYDYPIHTVHEDGVAAVAQDQFTGGGRVAVCERSAAGAWTQTETLRPSSTDVWLSEALALEGGTLAVLRRRAFDDTLEVRLYERNAVGAWVVVGQGATVPAVPQMLRYEIELDGPRVAVSRGVDVQVFLLQSSGTLALERTVTRTGDVREFHAGHLTAKAFGNGFDAPAAILLEVPQSPGTTEPCRLRGAVTCLGSGAAELRIHDAWLDITARRAAAEVVGAPPGATVLVFRSNLPGFAPALGGALCLDRRNAALAGSPTIADPSGRATVALHASLELTLQGLGAADHVQAVVLGPSTELTNALAWLP